MNVPLLFFAIDVAAIVCAALLGIRVLLSFPKRLNAQLVALILFNTICHVVLSRDDYTYWTPQAFDFEVGAWRPVLNFLRNSTPGLFMILAHRLFVDGAKLPGWLLGMFAVQMFLEEPAGWFLPADGLLSRPLEEVTPAVLQMLFVAAALYWCTADWRNDLINTRRRTRAAVMIVIGVQTIASSLLLRVVIAQDTVASYWAHEATVLFGIAVCVFILMRISASWLEEHLVFEPVYSAGANAEPSPERPPEHVEALDRLKRLMGEERRYLEEGLSLAGLAGAMGLPEYRLRALIHEQLGFRNFNAFLHSYRIRDACERLTDPAQADSPVLTIALSVGYGAVNTFNRGFRQVTGMTPTQYRAGNSPPADRSQQGENSTKN